MRNLYPELPEWGKLAGSPPNPLERLLLIQAVAMLSTQPAFSDMTPEQLYNEIRSQAAQVALTQEPMTSEILAKAFALAPHDFSNRYDTGKY
jgi:hypothetical protein